MFMLFACSCRQVLSLVLSFTVIITTHTIFFTSHFVRRWCFIRCFFYIVFVFAAKEKRSCRFFGFVFYVKTFKRVWISLREIYLTHRPVSSERKIEKPFFFSFIKYEYAAREHQINKGKTLISNKRMRFFFLLVPKCILYWPNRNLIGFDKNQSVNLNEQNGWNLVKTEILYAKSFAKWFFFIIITSIHIYLICKIHSFDFCLHVWTNKTKNKKKIRKIVSA